MAKVVVTAELSELIRSIRLQNNIPSKKLASEIDKSPAYISKLEKNQIKTIDKELLTDILTSITQGSSSFDVIIEEVFATLKFLYTAEEIERQLWFENFDTTIRLLPIPDSLIVSINEMIEELGVTRELLLERINANESLSKDIVTCGKYPQNEWFRTDDLQDNVRMIIIQLPESVFNGILDGKLKKSVYINLYAIAFYLQKIKACGNETQISDDKNAEIMTLALDMLNKHKFYSLVEKDRLLSATVTREQEQEVLDSFDIQNQKIISDILPHFIVWSAQDIVYANQQFQSYEQNLEWDIGFMMKLMSLKFSQLTPLNYTTKKKLLDEIEQLIEKYKKLPEDEIRVEIY